MQIQKDGQLPDFGSLERIGWQQSVFRIRRLQPLANHLRFTQGALFSHEKRDLAQGAGSSQRVRRSWPLQNLFERHSLFK